MKCKCGSTNCVSAYVEGTYYPNICRSCLNALQSDSAPTGSVARFNRLRDYEDMAQDTVQPWDASGKPNVEFFRLYPESAAKQFSVEQIEELKRKI